MDVQEKVKIPPPPLALPSQLLPSAWRRNAKDRPDSTINKTHKRTDAIDYSFLPGQMSSNQLDLTALRVIETRDCRRLLSRRDLHSLPPDDRVDALRLTVPGLFRSVCVCEPLKASYLIRYRSKHFTLGPRGLKLVAESSARLLKPGHICDITTRPGANQRPIFVLEYANTLISQKSGLPAYVLAAQMDVTMAIHELAIALVLDKRRKTLELGAFYQHANDHLIDSGVFFASASLDTGTETAVEEEMASLSIDWLTVDNETTPSTPPKRSKPNPHTSAIPAPILAGFTSLIHTITTQHARAFILSSVPSSPDCASSWQITHTSPALYHCQNDCKAALSRTNAPVLHQLGTALRDDRPVSLNVQWGVKGQKVLLRAEPMWKGESIGCWLCFLTDGVAE